MRSVRHADVFSLPNLVFNGGLDYLEPKDHGTPLPHYWAFDGLVARTASEESVDSYDVVLDEDVSKKGELRDYMRLFLIDDQQVSLRQSFLSNAVLDFPVPLSSASGRSGMQPGYLSRYERLLSRSRDYTFGVNVRVRRGTVDVSIRFLDEAGNPIAEEKIGDAVSAAATSRQWLRYTGVLTPSATPASAAFVFQRRAGSELTEVHVGFFQLSLGAYDQLPYTGDMSLGVIPKDSVVLVMGASCPPGFVVMDEPDVAVPEDWLADDVEALPREGNFPIGSVDPASDALQGSPTHNRDEGYDFDLTQDDTVPFESFDSRWGSATTGGVSYNPNVRSPADEPDEDGVADHQHNVLDAGSIPVNRQFKFCRRL